MIVRGAIPSHQWLKRAEESCHQARIVLKRRLLQGMTKQQHRYSHSLVANNNTRNAPIFYPIHAPSSSLMSSFIRFRRPCCGTCHEATFATKTSDMDSRGGGERVMDNRAIYGLLKLSKFTKSEFNWRFDRFIQAGIDRDDDRLEGEQQRLPSKRINNVQKQQEGDQEQLNENIPSQQKQSMQDAMSVHDLEAYLLERYQRIEEEYNSIQSTTKKHHDNETTQRIQQCSTEDAAFIFHRLLLHAPIDTRKSSNILQTANTFATQSIMQVSPSSTNTFELCETVAGTDMTYIVLDCYTGNFITSGTWVSDGSCQTVNVTPPSTNVEGLSSWSGPGLGLTTDWGAAVFDPGLVGAGSYRFFMSYR